MLRRAFYAGTFDPITNGHIDLVERAARMFDEVVVAVAENADKQPLFSLDERVSLTREVTADIGGVRVIGFSGLLIDCMRAEQTRIIIRGLRAVSDFEYEFQLAAMNRRLDPNIETVFLTPSESHTFVSASLVKEIAKLKGDVSQFLHPSVFASLQKKLS
ncbi:MAG: pantetheine-phosphate adenylyltransferase [Gammaproteobacteria bacterium]|nr:pantetheine-phosphate adenylyltransferase [Gammaproteobacteria bacterium]